MSEYHKIQSVFMREPHGKRLLIEGEWTLPEFAYLADNEWVFTEKVDGTNIRIIIEADGARRFAGRTDNAQIPAPLVARLNERFNPQDDLMFGGMNGVVLYGEGYGPKIQKVGGSYRADQDFVLFDVRVGDWWLQRADVEAVARALGLDVVPIIGTGTLRDAVARAKEGIRSTWGDFQAEGIVARPKTELCTRAGKRIITKVKCRDFDKQ